MARQTSLLLNDTADWYLTQLKRLTQESMTRIIGQALYHFYHLKTREAVNIQKEKSALAREERK